MSVNEPLPAIRVASTMVMGWKIFGPAEGRGSASSDRHTTSAAAVMAPVNSGASWARVMVAGLSSVTLPAAAAGVAGAAGSRAPRNIIIPAAAGGGAVRPLQTGRARGIGSRFASRATVKKEAWK